MRLKWYEIRLASMATLMPVMEYSLTPCWGRQLDTAGTCAPMKTPVELLRSAWKSQPACGSRSP